MTYQHLLNPHHSSVTDLQLCRVVGVVVVVGVVGVGVVKVG